MHKQLKEFVLNMTYDKGLNRVYGSINYIVHSNEDTELKKTNTIEFDESNAKIKDIKDMILTAIKIKEGIDFV